MNMIMNGANIARAVIVTMNVNDAVKGMRLKVRYLVKIFEEEFPQRFQSVLALKHVRAIDISRATGVTCKTLSRWKHGKSIPHINTLKLVVEYINVPIEVFTEEHFVLEV